MAKYKSASKLPKNPAQRAASVQQARGYLSTALSSQSRLQTVLRGAFGPPKLRRGGTNIYGYEVKKMKGEPGWRNPYG